MDRTAIAGVSLRETDVETLEPLRRIAEKNPSALRRALADELGASELVLLLTCNRLEVIYAREEGDLPEDTDLDRIIACLTGGLLESSERARDCFHHHFGASALRHLLRVASSLESLVLGEDQILAQVREAFADAQAEGMTGTLLEPQFELAFRVGKEVRSRTQLSRHPVSVVSLAVAALLERAGERPLRVALVGAGKMAQLLADSVTGTGLDIAWVVNRNKDRAHALAQRLGATVLDFEELRRGDHGIDALLAATASPEPVLSAAELGSIASRTPRGEVLFGVDVAMPRDLEACEDPRVEILDLEALRRLADENRERRSRAAAEAEWILQGHVDRYLRRGQDPHLVHTLTNYREASREMRERELAALSKRVLGDLDEEKREAVARWAHLAFGRLDHLGFAALKDLARRHVDSDSDADVEPKGWSA